MHKNVCFQIHQIRVFNMIFEIINVVCKNATGNDLYIKFSKLFFAT